MPICVTWRQILEGLARGLDIRKGCPVAEIRHGGDGVTVVTAGGEEVAGDAVLVTAPLGVLKAGSIAFSPPLPDWKTDAVGRLGFGDLNKVCPPFTTQCLMQSGSLYSGPRKSLESAGAYLYVSPLRSQSVSVKRFSLSRKEQRRRQNVACPAEFSHIELPGSELSLAIRIPGARVDDFSGTQCYIVAFFAQFMRAFRRFPALTTPRG
jgi:hypothetical protein